MLVDQRSGARKIVRTKAVIAIDGMKPFPARTLDLGASGMSISFDHKLEVGQMLNVSFELYAEGKAQILTCRSKVNYCIFSGDAFKIGVLFVNLDLATAATINKYLR